MLGAREGGCVGGLVGGSLPQSLWGSSEEDVVAGEDSEEVGWVPLEEVIEGCLVWVGAGGPVASTSFLRVPTVWPGCFSYVPASGGGRGMEVPLV